MLKLKALTVMTAVLALLLAGQVPASAHGDKVFHNKDFATVAPDHRSGSLCDEENDNHYVRAVWYYGDTGGSFSMRVEDGTGCESTQQFSQEATYFEICEQGKGCKGEFT